jgi:hypothetical protein
MCLASTFRLSQCTFIRQQILQQQVETAQGALKAKESAFLVSHEALTLERDAALDSLKVRTHFYCLWGKDLK